MGSYTPVGTGVGVVQRRGRRGGATAYAGRTGRHFSVQHPLPKQPPYRRLPRQPLPRTAAGGPPMRCAIAHSFTRRGGVLGTALSQTRRYSRWRRHLRRLTFVFVPIYLEFGYSRHHTGGPRRVAGVSGAAKCVCRRKKKRRRQRKSENSGGNH